MYSRHALGEEARRAMRAQSKAPRKKRAHRVPDPGAYIYTPSCAANCKESK